MAYVGFKSIIDAAAELGRNLVSKHIQPEQEMGRFTRGGTAEPVSRGQILGANADREIFIFPV